MSVENENSNIDKVVKLINKHSFFAVHAGQAHIYTVRLNKGLGYEVLERCTITAFKDQWRNKRCQFDADKSKSYGLLWLDSPNRREYEQIEYCPYNPWKKDPTGPNTFNSFLGYSVKPVKGDWGLLKNHIFENIGAMDNDNFAYIMNWMARIFQYPQKPNGTAIFLTGDEGTGKGTLCNELVKILGSNGLHITHNAGLVGKFNAHLSTAMLAFVDEAIQVTDKQPIAVIKGIITEDRLQTEDKFHSAKQTRNYINIIAASNDEVVVKASQNSRRYAVFHVSNAKMQDTKLYELLKRDISKYNPRDIPMTAALYKQRESGLSGFDQWWRDVLIAEEMVFKSDRNVRETVEFNDDGNSQCEFGANFLYQCYEFYCEKQRVRPGNQKAFYMNFAEYGYTKFKRENKSHYRLYSLTEARRCFLDKTKLPRDFFDDPPNS